MLTSTLCGHHIQSTVMGDITCAFLKPCPQHDQKSMPTQPTWQSIFRIALNRTDVSDSESQAIIREITPMMEEVMQSAIPNGVSQWRNWGIERGYDKYFQLVWPDQRGDNSNR